FSLVIPQGAKNAADAWTAMQWMSGENGQRIFTQESKSLPTWEALLSDHELFPGPLAFFAKLLPTAKNRPPLPVGTEYWDELGVAWQKTYLNQGAPADLLKTARDRVNADLEQFCPIAAPATA